MFKNGKSERQTCDNQDETPRVKRRTKKIGDERNEVKSGEPDGGEGPLLVGLTWPTRLTIILVGASLLFSVFFGLEFLVAKLVASLEPSETHQRLNLTGQNAVPNGAQQVAPKFQALPPPPQTFIDELSRQQVGRDESLPLRPHNGRHQWWSRLSEQRTSRLDDRAQSSGSFAESESFPALQCQAANRGECNSSKLGVNFELVYESQLELEPDGRRYRLPGGVASPGEREELLVQPARRLRQLLDAHHVSMPFDPDIWTLSEPREQARHLLSGHLHECRAQLHLLVESIERALATTDGHSSATNGSGAPPPPLARTGHQHYQLMRLLDAQGRPEAATLTGHPFWLGSYLECRQFNSRTAPHNKLLVLNGARDQRPLETRYCVGKLAFKSWLDRDDGQRKEPSIKVGVCVPRSCDSLELFRHAPHDGGGGTGEDLSGRGEAIEEVRQLVERLIGFNMNEKIYPSAQMKLLDVFCLPERRQLSAGAFLLILAALTWLSFLVLCTLERWRRLKKRGSQRQDCEPNLLSSASDHLLECMAIDVNFQLFLSAKHASNSLRCPPAPPVAAATGEQSAHKKAPTEEPVVNLNVLDSVKHLGCAGVVGAHVLLTYLTLGSSFQHTIETMGRDMRTMLLLSLNNIVDTFFVISGLLVAYLTFKKLDAQEQAKYVSTARKSPASGSGKQRSWLGSYLHIVASRYLRMAPMYFLVYAFSKLLSVHLGEGPLWDYATNSESTRGLCARESWLWALGFASDFKPLTQHCVPPAWSISVDIQFFLVVPLCVRALSWVARSKNHWRQVASYTLLAALIATSSLLTIGDYKALLDYVSPRDFAKLRLHVFTVLIRYAAHAYSQPQNRVGPILIGMISGHLLFEYEQRRKQSQPGGETHARRTWPWWMRGRYFRLTLWACGAFLLAPCLVQLRERARFWAGASEGLQSAGLKRLVELVLMLWTSDQFDCRLALCGLVLIKPLWSAANCLVFLRLATDLNQGLWARFMSLPVWQILSKLNYAVLLIHFELIAYEAMSRLNHEQVAITWPSLLAKFAYAYLFSLCLAVALYVLFEQPLHRLTRSLLAGWPVTSSRRSEPGVDEDGQSADGIDHCSKQVAAASSATPGNLRQQLEDMQEESRVRRLEQAGERERRSPDE